MLSRVFHARCAKAAMIIAAVVCLAPLAVSIVGDVGGGLATPLTVSMPELLIAGLVYLGMFVVVGVVEDLDVGAARRAVAHPQLDLIGTTDGLGDVLEADVFGSVEP